MTDPAADPFPADALELNRAGTLTDQQRARFTRLARSWRSNELVGALVLAVAGLVLLTGTGPASSALVRFGGGAGALVIAAFFLVRSFPGADPIGADLRSGRVESIEGAFRKTSWSSGGGNTVTHYSFEVAGTRFDPAVLTSPMAAVQALAGAFRAHDRGRLAEAAAATVMGRTQRGHWSVDAAGRLHHDAQGADEVGDAWIVGDTLTIIDGEMALAWQRVGAG